MRDIGINVSRDVIYGVDPFMTCVKHTGFAAALPGAEAAGVSHAHIAGVKPEHDLSEGKHIVFAVFSVFQCKHLRTSVSYSERMRSRLMAAKALETNCSIVRLAYFSLPSWGRSVSSISVPL